MRTHYKLMSLGVLALSASLATACGGAERDALRTENGKLKGDLATAQKHGQDCDAQLANVKDQNAQMAAKLTSLGQNVDQLTADKTSLAEDRAALAKQVDELNRMKAAAEQRNAEYKKVMDRLKKMIDAGTLQVKIRNGRMVVQMSSDVVFPPGGIAIKPEAKEAISQLAQTIKEFPDRKFQVVGHSDNSPIKTATYPSNWELSARRAVEVVKLMITDGVPPTQLSAAGNGEFDPLAPNDTTENKTLNRRVEIVFMPNLDELPGFDASSMQR